MTLLAQQLVEETVTVAGRDLRILRPRDSDALLREEAFEHEQLLPYWAELWPSGVALAREVGGRALRGARVLDLGCGLGLVATAAALAGGRVVACDWSAEAVAFAAENARRNGARIETLVADFGRPQALAARGPWQHVLAADVLYERRNVPLVLQALAQVLAPGGEAIVADPGRSPAEGFGLVAQERGWETTTTTRGVAPEIRLHRLRRRRGVPVIGAGP